MTISFVITENGKGTVLATETLRGSTSYLVSGEGFEGWYPESQVSVVDTNASYQYGHIHDAAWKDVREKAKRLRSTGQVNVVTLARNELQAIVNGDTGIYDVQIHRKNASGEGVTWWDCDCEWGKHAWNRFKYLGRMCSHTLAAYYTMQSENNRRVANAESDQNTYYEINDFLYWAESHGYELIFLDQIADAMNDYKNGADNYYFSGDVDFSLEEVLSVIYDLKEDNGNGPMAFASVADDVKYANAEDFLSWLTDRSIIGNNAEISAFDDRTIRDMVENFEKSGVTVSSSEDIIQQLKRSHGYNPQNLLAPDHEFKGTNINSKVAGRQLTYAEQQELIDEEGEASQLSNLNLNGTFYLA